MSIHKILCVLVIFVIVVDGQRPIGTFLTNVGDLFGYDVFRRPRIVLAIPATIPVGPAAAPAPAAPSPPAAAGAPPPAAPAPAAASSRPSPPAPALTAAVAPASATNLLTDSVRRQFSINLNWDRNRSPPSPEPVVVANLVGPTVALTSSAAVAPAAAPQPVVPVTVAPTINPAAAPVPVPVSAGAQTQQVTPAPSARNTEEDDSEERDSVDYEDRPRRFQLELPDYGNKETTDIKREVDNDIGTNIAKEKFKKDFRHFWDNSPWTVEHGYKYIVPENPGNKNNAQDESKEISRYQVYQIPNTKIMDSNLKVNHNNIDLYEIPAEELVYAPSTAVTYFELPPASLQVQNVGSAQDPSVVAAPSYLTSKVVNAALLNYFDQQAKKNVPNFEQPSASYLTSKAVNAELLKYFDQKFKNDAIRKQQESSANPVDNTPYQQDYIHPVSKSIPHLVNPQSSLEYYSKPDSSPPASSYQDDAVEEDLPPKKTFKSVSPKNSPRTDLTPRSSPVSSNEGITVELPVLNEETPEKIIIVDQDIRYNPDDGNYDSAEEQKNLENAKGNIEAAIRDTYEVLNTNHKNFENTKNKQKYNPKLGNKNHEIVDINDNENFEVENVKDHVERQQTARKEKEEEGEEQNEDAEERENYDEKEEEKENEEEDEKEADKENETEDEKEEEKENEKEDEREDGNEDENEDEKEEDNEKENESEAETKTSKDTIENQKILDNFSKNEGIKAQENESLANSESKKQINTEKNDVQDLEEFIEKHFSDFKIPDYESIREEVRSKDFIANQQPNSSEENDNEEKQSRQNEEYQEDSQRRQQEVDESEDVKGVDNNGEEKENVNREEDSSEEKENTEEGDSSVDEKNNVQEDDAEGEDEKVLESKEALESEERSRIRELEEQHEKDFYSIFPKLGEGSAFINFFSDEDNNGKNSKLNEKVLSDDDFYKTFYYKTDKTPQKDERTSEKTHTSTKPAKKPKLKQSVAKSENERDDPIKNFNIHNQYEQARQSFVKNIAVDDGNVKKYQSSKQNLIDNGVSRNNFQNKDSHESTERTIVQPLYSGVWQGGALQELYKSDKPVTVPFDHEYSASASQESYKPTEAPVRVRRAIADIDKFLLQRPETLRNYDKISKYKEDFVYEVPELKISEYQNEEDTEASDKNEIYLSKTYKEPKDYEGASSNLASKNIEDDIEKVSRLFDTKVTQIKKDNTDLENIAESTLQIPKTKYLQSERWKRVPSTKRKYKMKENKSYDSSKEATNSQEAYPGKDDVGNLFRYLDEKPEQIKDFESNHEYTEDFTFEVPEPNINEPYQTEEVTENKRYTKNENIEKNGSENIDESVPKQKTKSTQHDNPNVEEGYVVDGSSLINEYENNNEYVADSYNQRFTYEAPEPTTPNYAKLEKKDYEVDESLSPNLWVTSNSSGRKKVKVTIDKPEHRVLT